LKIVYINSLKDIPVTDAQYITQTQSEKDNMVQHGFPHTRSNHEFQGSQAEHVAVVRLNPIPSEEIFLRDNYALTAITRHTKTMTYYTVLRGHQDALSSLMRRAMDVYSPDHLRRNFGARV